MNNFVKKLICLFLLFTISNYSFSQSTTISGSVSDENGALIGVNIIVKGKVQGTISDRDGNFTLNVNETPLTLVFSIVGYGTQEVDVSSNVSNLDITMSEDVLLGQEVVISASRVEQSILRAPVTIEKMDLLDIQNTATADFMDQLEHIKGIKVSRGSLNFAAVNTRGFATDANTRFVQLVDGMDTSAPLLNFPTGNLVGINPLDLESIEIVPGASSALYGPNAYNGTMLMSSKSPFEYQGLSVQVMQGFTQSARGNNDKNPYAKYNLRYAKAINDKLAIKVNFSYDLAEDWIANDYTTNAENTGSTVDLSGQPNFNGLNLHGDETAIILPIGALAGAQYASFGVLNLRRTGLPEESLLDNNEAKNMKYDIGLNYRVNDNLEASLLYRKGGGNTIYTGTQKYALRDFGQEFYKLTLKSDKVDFKVYQSITDAGNSYNIGALGAIMNEAFSPSATQWVPTYIQSYIVAMQGYTPFPAGDVVAAHNFARSQADAGIPAIGSAEYNAVRDAVMAGRFQTPSEGLPSGGSGFFDNSKLTHAEINYDLADWLLVGANYRNYSIFTEGTIFNEDYDGDGVNERISIGEWGAFGQINTEIVDGLNFTGSLRYDKNQNYEGNVTPRLALVYSFGKNSNIRVNYQTGFRNPDTQSQFIFFPTGTSTLLGTAKANAERYGVMEGGAWSAASYGAFLQSGGVLDAAGTPVGGNASLLTEMYVDYIKPEKLSAYEIGYKGVIGGVLLADINYFKTFYTDFEGGENVALKLPTTHKGNPMPAGSIFALNSNSKDEVQAWGIGVGLTLDLGLGYTLVGNYNFMTEEIDYATENSTFQSYFNTPENMYSFTFGNRELFKNFGFSASLRFQDEFLYQSTFSNMNIPAYGSFDAQVNYKVESIKTIIKLGGNHIGIGNNDYRARAGGPFVGKTFYLSLTFDEFLN
jgi:iron complex outermembrane recepter protein